jgi:D-lactate dehydrogenase
MAGQDPPYNHHMPDLPQTLCRDMATLLGDAWLRDDSERLAYAYDNSRKLAVPDAVALPTSRRCRS